MDDRFPAPDALQPPTADAAPDAALDDQTLEGQDQNAPSDAASPDPSPSDPAAELSRLRAEHEQARAQLEQERAARAQYEQQLAAHQRQMAENAARQWQVAEQELQAALPQMDPDEAVRSTREFYQARERALLQNAQQVQQQAHAERVASFAQAVAKEHGLSEQDARQLLLTPGVYQDPNVIVPAAQAMKQGRETQGAEVKRLQQQIDQLQRQMQGQGLKPAWQAGGANVSGRSSFDPKDPTYDEAAHYAALLRQGRPG